MAKWKQTRLGIIDLGTNSVRFDVHAVFPPPAGSRQAAPRAELLHREKLMVRLGENVFITGRLERSAIRRTIQAFSSFKRTADDLRVDKMVAFGTSALREATDADRLIRALRRVIGINVRIISGKEEAKLIATGILGHEREARGEFGLIDIGGGSTEISVSRQGKLLHSESFPLGAARLQQVFLKSSPPERGLKSVRDLREHIQTVLHETMKTEKWAHVDRVIGSSGTIRALGKIFRKNGNRFITREGLKPLIKKMAGLTLEELQALPGMEPKRVDLILAGSVLLEECMKALGAKKCTATDYSLRDGILDQELGWIEPHQPHATADLSAFMDKACSLGGTGPHLRQLLQLADLLFTKLHPLHGLVPEWSSYLKMAVLLRDTGRAISPVRHESHAYYVVKNADLPMADDWEREFVAQLCLRHEEGKHLPDELPFKGDKSVSRKDAFGKLLAILRVVDALDAAYPRRVTPQRIFVRPDKVRMILERGASTELALLRLQQKSALFEEVFAIPLIAESA